MDVELLVVQGQPRGKALHFPPGEFLFGRGPECHVRPNSDWISRQHCLLRVTQDTASIRDLGSSTGLPPAGMFGYCRHSATPETDPC